MGIHIGAKRGEIAELVIMPGDPLRAKWIAENMLTRVKQYNEIRGMLGFTGIADNGKRISVQGSGMGTPSFLIYANELITEYGVKRIVRVGTCGSLQKNISCREIILVMGASSDSSLNRKYFGDVNFAATASWRLLKRAYEEAERLNIKVKVGNVYSTDHFYDNDNWEKLKDFGAIGVEMEAHALYVLGAKTGIETLAIVTVSDNIITDGKLSPDERENSLIQMVQIALQL